MSDTITKRSLSNQVIKFTSHCSSIQKNAALVTMWPLSYNSSGIDGIKGIKSPALLISTKDPPWSLGTRPKYKLV